MLTVADQKQRNQTEKVEQLQAKVEQLQANLDMTTQLSRGKDQHISELESELQAVKVKLSSSSDQLEQLQRELEMLHEKSKAGFVQSVWTE